ncbi:MAG: hypothetical protein ACM3NQ_07325 [Bacteroidales bacterium]
MLFRVAACLFLVALGSCVFFVSTAPTSAPNVVIVLSTGPWEFCPDRTWSAVPGSPGYPTRPSDGLSESDYRPSPAGGKYSVVIGEKGESVSIDGSPQIRGTRSNQTDQRVTYTLNEGLFAGGRLVVWREGSGYQAELTIYGSGVPVARSERGSVVRANGS